MPGPLSWTITTKRPSPFVSSASLAGGLEREVVDLDRQLGEDAGLLAGVERVVDGFLDRGEQGLRRVVEAEQVAVLGEELGDRDLALLLGQRLGRDALRARGARLAGRRAERPAPAGAAPGRARLGLRRRGSGQLRRPGGRRRAATADAWRPPAVRGRALAEQVQSVGGPPSRPVAGLRCARLRRFFARGFGNGLAPFVCTAVAARSRRVRRASVQHPVRYHEVHVPHPARAAEWLAGDARRPRRLLSRATGPAVRPAPAARAARAR